MTRKISAIFIISLLIVAFLGFSAFGAYKPNVAKAKKQQMIQKLSDQTPIKVEGAEEYHGYTGSSSVDEGPQSLGFDENIPANPVSAGIPPIGNPSPGTWIGTTTYDYQTNGSPLRRVDWRGTNLIQFAWMKKVNFGAPYDGRRISYQAYNANNGSWAHSTSGSGGMDIHAVLGMVSGYGTLDVMPDGRAVIASHYSPTGDGDAQNTYIWTSYTAAGGYFPSQCPIPDTTEKYWPDPQADYRYLWPSADFQVDGMDTVMHVFAEQSKTGAGTPQRLMYFRKIGYPDNCTWDYPPLKIDIVQDLAEVVTASRVSRKVAIVWNAGYTSPPGDTITPDRGQQLNDIYYKINTNMGAADSWLPTVNVTKADSSKPSWMSYTDLSALYDLEDYLHIVWDARMFDFSTQTFPMGVGSRIFHYSDLNPGKISVVKDANWEIPSDSGCWGGAWNTMSLVKMSISQCDGKFYCLFTQYNDMFNGVGDDCHNANWTANYGSGTANGELYISVSSNGGLNWDIARNLTNSYTPHCDSAPSLGGTLECQSDMWATMSRFGKNSTGLDFSSIVKVDPSGSYSGPWYLDVFYVNDKYPGGCVQDQGVWTTNPMRWFRVPCIEPVTRPLLSLVPSSIQDPAWTKPSIEKDSIVRIENIGNAYLHVSDIISHKITGAEDWLGTDITWAVISDGSDLAPNFANMTVKLNKNGNVTSGPKGYDGFIEIISDSPTTPDTLPVHLIIADTVQFPKWAGIKTASKRIIFNNAGNIGHGGTEHQSLDFTWYGGDCDTANNVSGANDNAAMYLYDASPFVLYVSGNDTILNNYIWNSDWLNNDGFRPTKGLTVDSVSGTGGYNYASTGKFLTRDSVIALECEYFMPTHPDSSDFMVQRLKVYNNTTSTVYGVMIGELMDWDIPSDSNVENGSAADASRRMMYCYGGEYGADTGTLAPWNDCILANERAGGFSYYRGLRIKNPPYGQTDTIPIKGMFTGSNDNWQGGTGNFPPGTLYEKLWNNGSLFSGYEPWFSTSGDPDSEYIDLNMVAFYGRFDIERKDTLKFIKILATTKSQLTGRPLSAIVDQARKWIEGRPIFTFAPVPPILDNIGAKFAVVGTKLEFRIHATSPGGINPSLTASPLPSGAVLIDSANGAGSFSWTPAAGDTGVFNITFKAAIGISVDSEIVTITVNALAGLVARWTFNEGSGTIAYDVSGNSNNGTLYNSPTWIPGRFGNALSFDGVNDYISVPHSASLNINGAGISYMAWIYSPLFNDYGWIMGKGYQVAWENMVWWLLPGTGGAMRYGIKSGGTTTERDIPVGLTAYSWHHVAVVYDGSYMKLYLDGRAKDSSLKSGNLDVNTSPIFIGRNGYSPTSYYRGNIDEVKIYNRAVTPVDICLEFSGVKPGNVNGDALINALDITYLINFLYKHGPAPNPIESGNVNGIAGINILDVTYMINYLYKHGPYPICPN